MILFFGAISKMFNHHRKEVESARVVGCAECQEVFSPLSINVWIDCGQTALCPKCGSYSVIANTNRNELSKLHKQYF